MAGSTGGWRRVVKAAGYSWQGLRAAWQHEAAFRQEVVLTAVAVIIAGVINIDTVSRILLIGSVVLVVIVEILNSAVEAVVDRIGTDIHPLSGRAKDLGSAAVFVALLLAAFVWISVLWQWWHR